MCKSFLSAFLFTLLFISAASAQDFSIQGNGGIIMPINSSKGLSGIIQLNYSLNEKFQLYIYSGHSVWDRNIVEYKDVISNNYYRHNNQTYTADDHKLIPVIAGCRVNIHTNKIFTSFFNIEAGYSYLTYNSYSLRTTIDSTTGGVLDISPDWYSKKKRSENLFSIGIGAGISHPMSENINIILAFKLNTFINSGYNGFFTTEGTYRMFQLGVNFLI